ncbi:MAG: sugar transporter [bacterium]
MTPSSAKPVGSPEDPINDSDTSDTDAEASSGGTSRGAVTKLHAGSKRRANMVELRVARKRAADLDADEVSDEDADAEAAEAVTAKAGGSRGGRAVASRNGPRAKQRAARAALEEAAEADVQADDLADDTQGRVTRRAKSATQDPVEDETEADATMEARGKDRAFVERQVPAAPEVTAPASDPEGEDDDDDDDATPGRGRRGRRAEKRGRVNKNDASHYVVAPTVAAATMKPRHYGVMALFCLMVLIPTLSYSLYLWTRAADQYESDVGFGSRTEDAPSTFDFLGALGGVSQSSSKDMDILNQFIISQELVSKIDRKLDLGKIYSKATNDPLNTLSAGGAIEDKVAYWQRMVKVNYDSGTGLMTLRVFAFDPLDAQTIAKEVLTESTQIINDLSLTAQEDATRYSREALQATESKLSDARLAVLRFQVQNHIVDPSIAIANQNSVVGTLNQQLAAAQIDLDMLTGTVQANDPRLAQLSRRIDVIHNRIAEEQAKVGAGADTTSPGFANLMLEFEKLQVEQDFAQKAYLSALASYDQALTDAQHKTRYLATYVAPTLAESTTAPNRPLSAFLVALIGFLLWSVVVLVYYALRDRR